jgi:hypothetical protein
MIISTAIATLKKRLTNADGAIAQSPADAEKDVLAGAT